MKKRLGMADLNQVKYGFTTLGPSMFTMQTTEWRENWNAKLLRDSSLTSFSIFANVGDLQELNSSSGNERMTLFASFKSILQLLLGAVGTVVASHVIGKRVWIQSSVFFWFNKNHFSTWGSGCDSVGRAVASNARNRRFESSHRQFILQSTVIKYLIYWKDENK